MTGIAEVGLLIVGLGGAIAGRRWPAARWGALAVILAWGALTVAFRDDRARVGVSGFPPEEWAGYVATYLAAACVAGLATAVAAALVVAPRADGVASAGAAALWFAGGAVLWRTALLAAPEDALHLDAAVALRVATAALAVLALGWAARRGWAAPGLAVALIALHEGLVVRARARGPAPELAALDLPTAMPAVAARVSAGCLVAPDGPRTVGQPPPYGPVKGCPDARVPLVGLPAETPVPELARSAPPEGAVRVLFRIAEGWAMGAWRVSSLELPVWTTSRPLPGARFVWSEGGRTRVAWAGGVEDADPVDAVRGVPPEVVRLDVLIHPSAAPTVGALVERCEAVARARPVGARCVLALGDVGAWRARLGPPTLAAPIDDDFDVLEEGALEDFR